MIYTSIENKKIKNIKKLYSKKYRDEFNEFIIEGEHLVEEAYKKGILKELILEENPLPRKYKEHYLTGEYKRI